MHLRRFAVYILCLIGLIGASRQVWPQQRAGQQGQRAPDRDLLYVAVPNNTFAGFENMGGVGVVVLDVKNGYRFVKRIPTWDQAKQKLEAVRGVAASVATGLLYISTPTKLAAIDLLTDKFVWEQAYDGECCDRMTVSPDGKTLYVPGDGGTHWYAVDAATGGLIKNVPTSKTDGAHNTIWSPTVRGYSCRVNDHRSYRWQILRLTQLCKPSVPSATLSGRSPLTEAARISLPTSMSCWASKWRI